MRKIGNLPTTAHCVSPVNGLYSTPPQAAFWRRPDERESRANRGGPPVDVSNFFSEALMVRFARLSAVALALVAIIATAQARPDKEEKTLKGTITCAKCDLGVATKCATVIKVKDGDKEEVYYFDPKGDKQNHKTICQSPKEGTVTGTVAEKDGKKWVTVSKVEWKK
jgi:hypothetical protein